MKIGERVAPARSSSCARKAIPKTSGAFLTTVRGEALEDAKSKNVQEIPQDSQEGHLGAVEMEDVQEIPTHGLLGDWTSAKGTITSQNPHPTLCNEDGRTCQSCKIVELCQYGVPEDVWWIPDDCTGEDMEDAESKDSSEIPQDSQEGPLEAAEMEDVQEICRDRFLGDWTSAKGTITAQNPHPP
ncbi:hypothetical protein BaRGS_00018122 [Batillaria attramentaria]|uniref:Uncharacterized protein n=1 Tax=Batillaria attramentaria TaxID=370345 RepID=A0ABD0KV85_9CAEN